MADLRHVEDWVFDLDNTLYPAECNLFRQIDSRMGEFICGRLGVEAARARKIQKDLYFRYGTTLCGLMAEHAVAPDEFLGFVHDVDISVVEENAALAGALGALPGRRFIFTNGSVAHAENVLARLKVGHLFDDIFDIHAADYAPKPGRASYERFLTRHFVRPANAAMFEDIAHNLEAAFLLGMTTILVRSPAEWIAGEPSGFRPARAGDDRPDHVHHVTDDLAAFLQGAAVLVPETAS